jgi:hypothetical protein
MPRSKKQNKPVYIDKWPEYSGQMCNLGKCHFSVARLIDLSKDFEVMDVPLRHLNIYSTYEKLTLRQFVEHMRAILDADLSFPIILDEDGELMDGRHRIMKAMFENKTTIKAVRFDTNPPACKVDE